MARNGGIPLNNLVVSQVHRVQTGVSRIVASRSVQGKTYTITIEATGGFPDDMHVLPGGTLDVRLEYDPK